jgi:hypothetical protein
MNTHLVRTVGAAVLATSLSGPALGAQANEPLVRMAELSLRGKAPYSPRCSNTSFITGSAENTFGQPA